MKRLLPWIRLLTYAMFVAIVVLARHERRVVPLLLGHGVQGSAPLRTALVAQHGRDDFVAEGMTVEQAIKLAEEFARREGVKIDGAPITATTLRFKEDRPTWYLHYQLVAGYDPVYYTAIVDCQTGRVSSITDSPAINLPLL